MTIRLDLERDAASLIGQPWTAADTPALLVDLDRMEANIARMAGVARANGVGLRPHFKTHKSAAIARRQIAAGAIGLTASKLDEVEVLVDAGVDDILLAYELVAEPKLRRAIELAARARIRFAVDSHGGAAALAGAAAAAGVRLEIWIEIDCGLHRAGVSPADSVALARAIDGLDGLTLDGVFTHAGHAYTATTREQIHQIAVGEAAAVVEAAAAIRAVGLIVPSVSVGSTPTAEFVAREPGITEIRPGNYVFYDAVQVALGTVPIESTALSVAATVVSRPADVRAILDSGTKTLGLDKGSHGSLVVTDHGRLLEGQGALDRLSEEHGMLRVPTDSPLAPGDRVRVLPNHACSAANLGRFYVGIRDGHIAEIIEIEASGGVH